MKLRTALLGAVAVMGLSPAAFAERGTDGEVKLTFPQAVSIMNPYLSGGTKDILAAAMVLEPLAVVSPEGVLVPRLAVEIPTLENGGVSADMTSITWKLQPGLLWSDGTPLKASDSIYSFGLYMDPDTPNPTRYTGEHTASYEAPDEEEAVFWLDAHCQKWQEAIAVHIQGTHTWVVGAVCSS